MGGVLAIMFTMTTYGTWLRGDSRWWVDDGVTYPPDPPLEDEDRRRLKHPPFLFADDDHVRIGEMIGSSLIDSSRRLTVMRSEP